MKTRNEVVAWILQTRNCNGVAAWLAKGFREDALMERKIATQSRLRMYFLYNAQCREFAEKEGAD